MLKRIPAILFPLLLNGFVVLAQHKPFNNIEGISRIRDSIRDAIRLDVPQPFGDQIIFSGIAHSSSNLAGFYFGQTDDVQDHARYPVYIQLYPANPRIVKGQVKTKPPFSLEVPGSKIMLGVKLNPNLINYRSSGIQSASKHFPGYLIPDSSAATVIACGINTHNVRDYRYHIVADDSIELVHWSVPKLEQQYGAQQSYGLIGRFSAPGKQVVVEVVNIHNYSVRDGVVLDWRVNHRPVITKITAMAYGDIFAIRKGHNRGYAKKFDDATGLPIDLLLHTHSITRFSFDFKEHETVPYTVFLYRDSDGIKKQLLNERFAGNHYDLQISNYDKPGKYEFVVQPGQSFGPTILFKGQELKLPFEIVPRVQSKDVIFKQMALYILVILMLFAGVYLFYRQKLKSANQQKTLANLQLSSVRAQLNPHFMFNALTSIQNLVNNKDIDGTNHYLTKFAGITRQVLSTSGKELVSLEDELRLITDYLQMEQLRFGFEYSINVAKTINKANTEIPTMLLQPFIENAAKHGVSALHNKGKIEVSVTKQEDNLVLTVADNGRGFGDTINNTDGFGLKLSRERIELLNQLYKSQHINLEIYSNSDGAKITITLTHWF